MIKQAKIKATQGPPCNDPEKIAEMEELGRRIHENRLARRKRIREEEGPCEHRVEYPDPNDPKEKAKYEKMGRIKAEQRLALRQKIKEQERRGGSLTINTKDECIDNKCNITITPEMRAGAKQLGIRAYNIQPVTVQQEDTVTNKVVIQRDNWPDQNTNDPKVCLSMIVKNEGKVLRRCLESVKGHVDEIVIVDTGSTDDTVAIAKEFGAKVFEHPWEDSFSVARNWAIYHTDTQWLLQLDGDEELDKESGPKIREAVRQVHNSNTNLIHMVLVNINEATGEQQSIINTGKLMRVVPTLHFRNRVHNKLICPGHTMMTTLKIYHYGYALPDKEYMNVKKDRTTRLLHIQQEEQPEDPETAYYLGIQYLKMEDWDKSIFYAKQAIDLFKKYEPTSQLILLAYHVVACANYHKQIVAKAFDFKEAIEHSEMALSLYPDYADSNCILSSIYFAIKDYEKCLKYSERYLAACEMLRNDPSKSLVIPMNSLKNEWLIYLQLAINYFEQADSKNALYFLARSEDLLPLEQKYRPSYGVFKYLITRGDPDSLRRAEAIYQSGFRPDLQPIDEKEDL